MASDLHFYGNVRIHWAFCRLSSDSVTIRNAFTGKPRLRLDVKRAISRAGAIQKNLGPASAR